MSRIEQWLIKIGMFGGGAIRPLSCYDIFVVSLNVARP
jgi:hypothetical protein